MELKIKIENGNKLIYDSFRKKWVRATPEEMVRQRFCSYLVNDRAYPVQLIANECMVEINGMKQRCDTLVYKKGHYVMLIEYKAENVEINEAVFQQAFRYNSKIGVDYIVVTNLKQCYCCKVDYATQTAKLLSSVPKWNDL